MPEKRPFFACDDYGQGGIWIVLVARSAREIETLYPELSAFEEPPSFLDAETMRVAAADRTFDIDAPPSGYLAEIVADR